MGVRSMQARQCSSATARFFALSRFRWAAWLVAAAVLPLASPAFCQDKAEKKGESKEKEIPKPEDLFLPTADGVQLAVTYYPGPVYPGVKDKQIIPVVLLHMWKESRNDYKDLAPYLQKLGYAVIVPDLRGHGESTRVKGARKEDLNADKMSQQQLPLMATEDMMAVKAFLWERNNAGELNIDKLCIIGAEMGAAVALNFAAADAVQQEQNHVFGADREYKLGGFVKALVLLSPDRTFRGLPVLPALRHPVVQREIAVLILVGKQDAKAMEEARQINVLFKRHHPEPTGENKADKKTLFFGPLDTSLQGTKLLDPKFQVPAAIADFIDRRLVKSSESRDWGWMERKHPHQ